MVVQARAWCRYKYVSIHINSLDELGRLGHAQGHVDIHILHNYTSYSYFITVFYASMSSGVSGVRRATSTFIISPPSYRVA